MSYPFNFAFLYGAENDGNVPPLAVPNTFAKPVTPEANFNFKFLNNIGNLFNNVAANDLVQDISNNYPTSTLNDVVSYYRNNPNKKIDLVDVVKDFTWTISPKSSRNDVPYIWLNERYITLNAILNQALYGLAATFDNKAAQFIYKSGSDVLDTVAKKFESTSTPLSSLGLYNSIKQFIGEAGQDAANISDKILNKFGVVDTLGPTLESPLSPYKGLYFTVESGFNYKLPLFNSEFWNTNNDFAAPGGDSNSAWLAGLSETAATGGPLLEAFKIFNTITNQYGTYVEFPKQYNYGSTNTFEVTFDLINTKPATYTDVRANYKLLFLLFYQNLPIRRSKQLVDPPVIYNIVVPGQKRMPYAYLQRIAIKNLGATRLMNIDIADINVIGQPNTGVSLPSTIRTVIPDAYRVTLTFNDMIPETKNTVYSSFLNNSLIETSVI